MKGDLLPAEALTDPLGSGENHTNFDPHHLEKGIGALPSIISSGWRITIVGATSTSGWGSGWMDRNNSIS